MAPIISGLTANVGTTTLTGYFFVGCTTRGTVEALRGPNLRNSPLLDTSLFS